jgi:hypothetical protein
MDKHGINVQFEGQHDKVAVLVGNHLIELDDHSYYEFVTEEPDDFVEYLQDYMQLNDERVVVFCTSEKLVAVVIEAKYGRGSIAECNIKMSSEYEYIKSLRGREIAARDIDEILVKNKRYLDRSGLELLLAVRNMKFSSKISYERQVSDNGEYLFSYKRENDKAAGMFQKPDKIAFNVPVFDHADDSILVEYEVLFDFRETGEGDSLRFRPYFKLLNPSLERETRRAVAKIIKEALSNLDCVKYFGRVSLTELTDEWSYKKNNLEELTINKTKDRF